MKAEMQVEQLQEQQQSTASQGSGFGSNYGQRASLASNSTMTLTSVFGLIVVGQIQESKRQSSQLADRARQHQDNQTVQWAGDIWTVAHAFSEIQSAISQETLDGVQDKAALIGTLTRGLIGSGHISQESGDRVLQSAGGYWTMANKAKEEKSQTANGDTPFPDEGTAAGALFTAQNSETVEQYKLPTNRTWAHCGIATSMMLLQANGKGDMADANQLVSEMYISGNGTDVDLMAKAMRKRGLETAESTRNGTLSQLMETLKAGHPIPFGITHSVGDVVKMNKASSKHYANYKPGDRHYRKFGAAGHWVLVVGFEGAPEKPTHFLFNDPDVGGQLRATKSELEQMGVGNGQFFQITQ
jgi:hypothetical protein